MERGIQKEKIRETYRKIALDANSDCCSEECCSPDTSPKQELKEKIKERYGKIALSGNSDSCCMRYVLYRIRIGHSLLWLVNFSEVC
ncbi:MAG: hypothetical protein WB975_04160 [Nitrososphaeraceae archaeon]